MGGGMSVAKVNSTEEASTFITQQFAGTCNVQCQNAMDKVQIDLINTTLSGGINLSQTCSSDVNCIIGSSMTSTADTLLKAVNSSNAKNAAGWAKLNIDKTKINSLIDIRQNLSQATNQTCSVGSYNEMSDVNIMAVNSTIGGGINIAQTGNASGNCSFSSTLDAAAKASGMNDNNAQSGKDKLGQKKGSKSGKMSIVTYIIIGIIVLVVVIIIGRMVSGSSKSKESAAEIAKITAAKMAAGCPDGADPLKDPATGQPVVNPKTHGPYCPPPKIEPKKPEQINITIQNTTPTRPKSTSRKSPSKASSPKKSSSKKK